MSKRILAMLLTIALVLSCMPTVILAEAAQPEEHKCQHCDQVPQWVDWDGTAALEDGKHYRLTTEKLTLSAPIALNAGTYVLCLNGNTISGATSGRIFDLSGTADLTIVDHTAKTEDGVYTAGKLADATNSAVYVKGSASFTVYDGIMENNKRPSGKDGGCIFLEGKGSVQLKGGLYRDNFARYGAVVYMVGNRASQLRVNLLLENVHITGNTSTHTGAIQGDGLSTITVKDSVITGNSTTGTLTGGMYVTSAEGQLNLSGKVIIDGNTNKTAGSVNRNVILNNAAVKLNLDGITDGSRVQLKASSADPKVAITTTENQKSWSCSWITLGSEDVSWTDTDADGIVDASELLSGHYHDGVAYTPVTSATEIPLTGGNFYLTQDVKLAKVAAFGKTTNLCLNGHDIVAPASGRPIQLTKNSGAVLTLEDCSAYTDEEGNYIAGAITGCSMTSAGTVYINAGTTFVMNSGKISGNLTSAAGGVYNAGTFHLHGGEISDNKATNASSGCHGGGVYNAATFVMDGGVIRNNEAKNYGGGIFSNKAATITGGTVTGNKAVQGGGVALYKQSFEIGAVTIDGNTATEEGGGLWAASAATVNLNGTVITNNTVTGTNKGGGGVAVRDKAKVTLTDGQISGNHADASQGGGMFAVTADTEITMLGGTVSENTAKFGGGFLTSTDAKLTVKGGTIEKNAASAQGGGVYVSSNTSLTMEGGKISENTAKRLGGGIYNLNSTTTITGGTIENNSSEEDGGGIALNSNSKLELQGGIITGNTAPTAGGIYTTENSVLNISGNPQVVGNNAGGIAANLVLAGDSLLMNVGEMTEGAMVSISGTPYRAVSTPIATDYSGFFGSDSTIFAVKYVEGALYLDLAVDHSHCLCGGAEATGCDHGKVKFVPWESTTSLPKSGNYYLMNDVEISAQTRLEKGQLNLCLNGHTVKVKETGRIYYLADEFKLSITDCAGGGKLTGATTGAILTNGSGKNMALNLYAGAITGNHSTEHGGAVVLQGETVFNMYGGEISGNSAAEGKYGGALYVGSGATFQQHGGKVSENTATNGGAIYANRGTLQLLGGEISGNTATKDGGGIYLNKATAILSGTAVEGNTAENGAGITVTEGAKLTVSGGNISGNKAENGTGGGIFVTGEGAEALVEGGVISENAAKFGGAILTQTKAKLTMKGGTIEKNAASAQGGGVYVSTNTAFTMEGGKIAGNTAKRNGGGIYNLNSTTTILGGTIENNSSEEGGGGIALVGNNTKLELLGGIITGNTAPKNGGIQTAETTTLNISGNPQVMGNTAAEKASNLCLTGETLLMNVGEMTEGAKIGISGVPFRAISAPVATDYSSLFISDSTLYAVKYVEGALYLDVAVEHNHCVCGGALAEGCDHGQLKFAPWESTTTLPESGAYYLMDDVQLSDFNPISKDLTLCLNGYNIIAADGKRITNLVKDSGATLTIVDCTAHNDETGAYVSGAITGANFESAGAIYLNAGTTLKLYSGKISGNAANAGAGVYGNGGVFYMYGGELSGNKAVNAASNHHGGAVMISGSTGAFHMAGGKITGNEATEYGGAVFITGGAQATFTGGEISGNKAGSGGGIALYKAAFQVGAVTITGNEATKEGGGLWAASGANVTLNGTSISNNTAPAGAGVTTREAQITLKEGIISANNAPEGTGGGMFATGEGALITLEGGKISENAAKFGGGVLIQSKASLTMKGSTIEKNTTSAQGGGVYVSTNTAFTMEGGKIAGNTAKRNGGGIYNLTSTTTITGGSVENNRSEENGGGIALNGRSLLKISNATVSGNTAKANGGGISVIGTTQKDAEGKVVSVPAAAELLEGAVITGNATDSTGTGGGVFVKGEESYALVNGATISKNTAKYGAGMLCQTKSFIKIKSGKVTGNQSASNGGGLYISTNTTLYMEGGEVSGNSSKANGGGAYFLNSNLKLSGGKFSGNTAKADGGGWYMQLGNSEITGGSVSSNTAANGGGFRFTGGKHRISGLSVNYNEATNSGGGIYGGRQMVKENGVNVDKMPDFVANSITMVGNKTKSGGGILLVSKGAEYTIRNAYIAENNASSGGGGVYVSSGVTLNMYDSTITKNYGRTGGGVQHLSSAGYYENVEISENTGNNAAGMNVTKNGDTKGVTLKNVKILKNVGSASGAMVVQGASHFYADSCKFIGNSTPKTGGAIFVTTKAVAEINNTLFQDNMAGEDAGAVMLGLNTRLTMNDCSYIGNKAERNGGGIYNRGLMYVNNAKVENNSAGNNGGGIGTGRTGSAHSGQNCGLFLNNVTCTGNTAGNNGGGLLGSLGCHVVAKDLTLTNNTAAVNGGGAWAQEDFIVENLTATGNKAESGAVYLAKSYYDGQSYFCGVMSFKGLLQVKDNEGGGVFVGEGTTLTLEGEGLAEGSYLDVTLHSGVLGQKVFGVYNYEGTNPYYVLTPGDRSITDPELPEYVPEPEQTETEPTQTETQAAAAEEGQDNTGLYLGIGGIGAVIVLAAVALVIVKKKKSAKAETKE